MNALQSVSVACAAISVITVYYYLVALSNLIALGHASALSKDYYDTDRFFLDSDINFTAKKKSMVAVSSLIIICSIIEIILAVAAIRSSNITGQSSQEQQVREVDDCQILNSKQTRFFKLMISQLVSQLSVQSVNFRQNLSYGQSDIDLISHVFNQHVCQHAINKPVGDVCLPNCLDYTVCKRYFTIIDPSEGE